MYVLVATQVHLSCNFKSNNGKSVDEETDTQPSATGNK